MKAFTVEHVAALKRTEEFLKTCGDEALDEECLGFAVWCSDKFNININTSSYTKFYKSLSGVENLAELTRLYETHGEKTI